MTDYQPISCDIHDYVEIACLYRFEVELILANGETVRGHAQTTRSVKGLHEYLIIDSGRKTIEVDLASITSMRACDNNPHFDLVRFC